MRHHATRMCLIALIACGGSTDTGPNGGNPITSTGAGTATGTSTGSTITGPWDGTSWSTVRQEIYAVRCHADEMCDRTAWTSTAVCIGCGPPDDWADPPVLDHGLECLAEIKALANSDPCAAAVYWPPSEACSAYWSELGEWPPEEMARQSVIVAIRDAYSTCAPGTLSPAECDDALGACAYNPSSAAACMDGRPWPCESDIVAWGTFCQQAWDCAN